MPGDSLASQMHLYVRMKYTIAEVLNMRRRNWKVLSTIYTNSYWHVYFHLESIQDSSGYMGDESTLA